VVTNRVAPAVIFGVMDVLDARVVMDNVRSGVAHGVSFREVVILAGSVLYLAFVSLAILLFLVRPPARARDDRLSSWILAMVGTFGLLLAPLLPGGPILFHTGTDGEIVRSVVMTISMGMAVATLRVLGHSFGITPEARTLVTRGPYRWVRHPLYWCEAVTILALLLVTGELTLVILTGVVLAAQVRRAQLEESVLAATFPEYEEAFRGVPHFLPGIF
jgi:protein-S-isoprenylcysteine O-methyltransferase Ste14